MRHSARFRWYAPLLVTVSGALVTVAVLALAIGGHAAPSVAHAQPAAAAHASVLAPASSTSPSAPRLFLPTMERSAPGASAQHASSPPGNFPFQTSTSADGHIVVHYYDQYSGFGANLIAEVQRALQQQVEPKLGFSLNQRVDIYYYNSRADFLAGATPDNPEITGAYSTFNPFDIYIPVSDNDADTFATLAHELTHITFHQHVNAGHLVNDYNLFPLWFEEGQAESDVPADSPGYGEYDDGLVQNIRNGGQFINIFSQFVWQYPQDINTDDLSYAEGRAFVNYLYATYGATRYHQFVADAEDGNLLFAAELDFGADLQTVQSNWEKSLGLPGFHHAAGALPPVATPAIFTPGTLPAQATRTQPYAVGGGTDLLIQALVEAGVALLIVLAGLIAGAWWLRRRRQLARAREMVSRGPTYYGQPLYPTPTSQPLSAQSPYPGYPAYPAYPPYPTYPAHPPAPAGAPLPASRPLTYAETLTPAAIEPLPPIKVPGDLGWVERTALVLTVPVVLAAGLAWTLVDPSLSWRNAALAAAAVALALGVIAGVLGLRARKQHVLPLPYFVVCGVLLVAALTSGLGDAYLAGMAQGRAYEADSAYALATQQFAAAGAPAADRARVQSEWANDAFNANDFADATTHLRQAILLAPGTSQAAQDADLLLRTTQEWNTRLLSVQRFNDAIQVVSAQLAFTSCNAACKTALQSAGGADYVQWVQYLCAHKQVAQAVAEITALSKAYPGSAVAKSAQRALGAQSQGLAGAWAAAKAGDATAMDLLAELVAARTTDPLQLALASEASQPVTGTLGSTYQYKPDVHLFFVAFSSAGDARAFISSIRQQTYTDSSLFKVAAVTDAKGNFTVWLPGGYTYLPLWEGPAQHNVDAYYYYSGTTITVQPYTPLTLTVPISE